MSFNTKQQVLAPSLVSIFLQLELGYLSDAAEDQNIAKAQATEFFSSQVLPYFQN